MVEHSVHTRSVICSSQIAATRPVGQAVKTPPFHGGNMGSIPVRVTSKKVSFVYQTKETFLHLVFPARDIDPLHLVGAAEPSQLASLTVLAAGEPRAR